MIRNPTIADSVECLPVVAPAPDCLEAVRAEFPILTRAFEDGVALTYLDSAATTLKPNCVIDAIADHYRWHTANVHRGIHRLAEEATEAYEQARELVARLIGAASSREIVFTRGSTESINLVAHAWGRHNLQAGTNIVLSEMEHHANLVPWQQVAAGTGAELRFLPLAPDGTLDQTMFDVIITKSTRLVAVTAVSNVLGTVNPIDEIVARAHAVGARVLIDAAQHVPHRPIDVKRLPCDFLAFSGHKMCGADGIGVLYGRAELLEAMPPFMTGGEMVRRVRRTTTDWNELPWKFEAGTPPIASAIGLGAAIEFLGRVGLDRIARHDAELVALAYRRLSDVAGVRILGPAPQHRSSLVSFTVEGVHPHDLAQLLDLDGIAIRAGHHCAQPLHAQLDIAASARASFYLYNTPADVDRLIVGIERSRRTMEGR